MFDSPDPMPRTNGQFSLPLLAQAALYHAKGVRAEATFEVVLRAGSSPLGTAVAAGAWWAARLAMGPLSGGDDALADWAAGRAAAVGADRESALALLRRPFSGRVHALLAGTAVSPATPLLQVTGPLPEVYARSMIFRSALTVAVGAATAAQALVTAAGGRSVVDDASVRAGAPALSSLIAWCGRVGGMSGTTHARAGWEWGVPVVAVPQTTGLPGEATDGTVDADDIHASTLALARRLRESRGGELRRVRLSRPLTDEVDLERHFVLRRALDRHGLRRTRICAELPPSPTAVQRISAADSPVDLVVLTRPWWSDASISWLPAELPRGIEAPPRPDWALSIGRHQVVRHGDTLHAIAWADEGMLVEFTGPGRPLPTVPEVLSGLHPHRQKVSALLEPPADL